MTAYLTWQCGQSKLSLEGAQFVRRWRMRRRTALRWEVILQLGKLTKSRDSDAEPQQHSLGTGDYNYRSPAR